MKARIFTLAAFLVIGISLFGQDNETKENEKPEKITYSNITEFGFITASFQGFAFEATTAHGVALDKKHCFGLGMGIGFRLYQTTYYYEYGSYSNTDIAGYMPIFLNYRYYFKPQKNFSPHVNVSLGGLMHSEDAAGVYSSVTMGFRAGKFSFSSGLSLLAVHQQENVPKYYEICDPNTGYCYTTVTQEMKWKWRYPFGITLKWGFSF